MKTLSLTLTTLLLLSFSTLFAGDTIKEAEFKVFGNCGMCKNRIEKAMKIDGVMSVSWDKKTKLVSVSYNPDAVTVDSLQKKVASVGHDTEKFKASDEVYSKLPGCCLYRDSKSSH